MADVAISCLAVRYCKIPINIEYLRCSMSIGSYKFELRCWRFPRQGFALPRNDILDGAVQQHDKHQFAIYIHEKTAHLSMSGFEHKIKRDV